MGISNSVIIYLAMTTNVNDRTDAITAGVTTLRNMKCREWNKQMDIFKTFPTDPSIKSEGQWKYWEDKHLSPHISQILRHCEVTHSKKSMDGLCNGRTDNWWILENTTVEEVIDHIEEKIERDFS